MEIKTKRGTYCLIPQLGILVNPELQNDFNHLFPEPLEEEKIIAGLRRDISDDEIEERISSIRGITLNITENCNFRCVYCAYSGNYEIGRTHSKNKMSFDTARKMIEHLIGWITGKRRKVKSKSINIGLYGGEALTEPALIKDIVQYTRRRFREEPVNEKFEVGFRLNTNGYLLTDPIVDFLVNEDITIDVTLDGPKMEHDKFRRTKNGEKTWEVIWANLERIRQRYPGYWENVNFLITIHPFHCCEKIDRFFLEHTDYFAMERVSAYFVNMLFLKEDLKKKLPERRKNQESLIYLKNISKRLDDKLRLKGLNNDTHFSTMCFPGSAKLFAASDGTLHVCERIKQNLPIGDVDKGIDFDAVRKIQRAWNEEIIKNRCWECTAWSFCPICLSQNESKEGIGIDCKYRDYVERTLYDYLSLKEEEEAVKVDDKYGKKSNISQYIRELE